MRKRKKKRKGKRKIVILVTMAVFVFTTSAVLTNRGRQSQLVAVNKANSSKNITKAEKESKKIEQTQTKSNTNNKQANYSSTSSNAVQVQSSTNTSAINTNYSQFFKRDVFIGDSITQGISDYDFLDNANVYAKLGISLTGVDVQIAKAKKIQPQKILLLLGANDIENDGTTPAIFKERYRNVIRKIKTSMPNTKIYVQSILPVLPNAAKSDPLVNNTRIGQFNNAIAAMASEENITYLNIASLINDSNKNLYEPDGEHFKCQFYKLWLNYLEAKVK